MLFFCVRGGNAIVVMIAIPTSLFVTLFVMKLVGFTIDNVSLLAMTLIIGILVDDSIVVLDNVERHYEDGEAAAHGIDPRTHRDRPRGDRDHAGRRRRLFADRVSAGQVGRFLAEFGLVVTIGDPDLRCWSRSPLHRRLAGNWSLLSNWRVPRVIDAFTRGFERLRTF